ncbi:MAG: cupin domain-containing protein [Chitinophagales bacterium]|nr:cupin domain-containing protein [Chitinophagales bacterium]
MIDFKPTIDHGKVFNSQIMVINDQPNTENGIVLVYPKTDGPPIHKHSLQEEIFTVLEGSLDIYKENTWIRAEAGVTVHIPKNVAHTYKNTSAEPCYFIYKISPKGTFTDMMSDFERLINIGKIKSAKDIKSLIYLSIVFRKYKESVSSVVPPNFVMILMAGIGKILGFKIQ